MQRSLNELNSREEQVLSRWVKLAITFVSGGIYPSQGKAGKDQICKRFRDLGGVRKNQPNDHMWADRAYGGTSNAKLVLYASQFSPWKFCLGSNCAEARAGLESQERSFMNSQYLNPNDGGRDLIPLSTYFKTEETWS